jgi:hypothetical protein
MDGDKTGNRYTNFLVCSAKRHREIEQAMGDFGKRLLAPGRPPLDKVQIEDIYRILRPFRRLHGMFVQSEIYDKWVTEGKISDWSEGPRAEWETSRAEREAGKADEDEAVASR